MRFKLCFKGRKWWNPWHWVKTLVCLIVAGLAGGVEEAEAAGPERPVDMFPTSALMTETMRTFSDASGVTWKAYVGPPRPEWLSEETSLMFTAGARRQGTFPVPNGWEEWPDDQLAAFCVKLGCK